jgi:hypothetical protein
VCQNCVELVREILPNETLTHALCDEDGHWSIRSIVDNEMNMFTLTTDTKVTSKIFEMQILPYLIAACAERNWELIQADHQNTYPDFSIRTGDGTLIALDIKSTYRYAMEAWTLKKIKDDYNIENNRMKQIARSLEINDHLTRELSDEDENRIISYLSENGYNRREIEFPEGTSTVLGLELGEKLNTMTLGAFKGYFRNHDSTKNIMFPYSQYCAHICLCVIYTRNEVMAEQTFFQGDIDLHEIEPVLHHLEFCIQEKWRIANNGTGSGNTANIGAMRHYELVSQGIGRFESEEHFNWYWQQYSSNNRKNEHTWEGLQP